MTTRAAPTAACSWRRVSRQGLACRRKHMIETGTGVVRPVASCRPFHSPTPSCTAPSCQESPTKKRVLLPPGGVRGGLGREALVQSDTEMPWPDSGDESVKGFRSAPTAGAASRIPEAVEFMNQPQPLEGQQRINHVDGLGFRRNNLYQAAGGDDFYCLLILLRGRHFGLQPRH